MAVCPSLSCLRSFFTKIAGICREKRCCIQIWGNYVSIGQFPIFWRALVWSQNKVSVWVFNKISVSVSMKILVSSLSVDLVLIFSFIIFWSLICCFSDLWFADFLISDLLIPDLIYLTWWAFCESRVLVGLKCIPRARLSLSVWWIIYILFDIQLMCLVIITIVWQHHPQHHFFTSLGPPSSPSSSCSSSPS